MPPKNRKQDAKDVEMEGSEDDWVDEQMDDDNDDFDVDEEPRDIDDADDHQDHEDDSLARLSAQYRRFSDARHALEQKDDNEQDQEEEHGVDDDEEEVHSDDEHNENHSEDFSDDEDHPLAGALRALANNSRAGASAGPAQGGNRSLAENMARMFPEAMGLLGGFTGGTRISGLIEGLSRRDDPYLVLETLNELSERLLIMNGIMAERGLPSSPLSHAIVDILNEPLFQEELELQLVACRCLYNFLEINLDYIHTAVAAGAIEALQSKLFEISYIDLAEQALQTLEFISRVSGTQIFRKHCLGAVLQYLDFFTIHAQRKAVTIVANSVKYIRQSEVGNLDDVLPALQRIVIECTDPQELESAWLAISRIIKNFKGTVELEKLVTSELLTKMIRVISNPDTPLSTNMKLINALSICAQNNTLSLEIIKSGNIAESLLTAMGKYKKSNDTTVTIEALMAAPKDLIVSILDLINCILPPEPSPILTYKTRIVKDYTSVAKEYKAFVNGVFPLLINTYSSSVLFDIRRRVAVALVRIISSLDDINDLKDCSSIINLLASIVIQNKSIVRSEKNDGKPYTALLGSLILTHSLIEKNPDTFITEFEREGLLADTSSLLEILRLEDMRMKQEGQNDGDDDDDDDDDNGDDEIDGNEDEGDEEMEDEQEVEDQEVTDSQHEGEDIGDEEEGDEANEDGYMEDEDNYDEHDDDDAEENVEEEQDTILGDRSSVFRDLTIPQAIKHLTKLASQIEQIYLSKKASGDAKLEHLRLLDEICGDLTDEILISGYTSDDWTSLWSSFHKALAKDSYVISSFELISSGVIELLSGLFNKPQYGSFDSPARLTFMSVFKGDIFETLVEKLQESLTRSESFEIIGCGLNTGENRAASLGKQLKVKVTAVFDDSDEKASAEDRKLFEGLNQLVILVHAVASFSNIGTFLKRRIMNPFLFGLRRNNTAGEDWSIEFLIDGEVIPHDTTIYGAIYKHCQTKKPGFDTNSFWYQIHEVQFRKCQGATPPAEIEDRYPDTNDGELENMKHPITVNILSLLRVLFDFRTETTLDSLFLNFKLTAKLNRQLEEPLIVASGILPNWSIHITRKFPFLFPLETRIFFLQSTSFGYSRLIQLWNTKANQDNEGDDNSNNERNGALSLGRPTRQKVRVARTALLKSALKVLDKLGAHPSILEVEFTDEVGTGLGPTLEFYSNVCHEFAEKKHGLWRDESDETENYVRAEKGLFPAPLQTGSVMSEKLSLFKNLGKFIARALLDSRILDFHFNPAFFEICAAMEIEHSQSRLGLPALHKIDKNLYQSLKFLQENPAAVGDMGINFTLPGYDIELVEDGANKSVDSTNVSKYIELVVDYTLNKGIKEQVENFVIGFSEVFPYYSMLIFSPTELVELLGNFSEDWSYATLLSSIHADHGYNVDSSTVQNLLKVMSSFDSEERRAFLKFMTGSPRLPIGGFKNLRPVFTVVRKHEEDGLKPDDYLPSVMTCANYLKLPEYSSIDILKERLMKAVMDGADVFLLS